MSGADAVRTGDLTEGQRRLLDAVAGSRLAPAIYLTGGTALAAAYLHHRRSLDIDFFSRDPIDTADVLATLRTVADGLSAPTRVHDRVELTATLGGERVRVEFVHYAFDRIAPSTTRLHGLEVDSLRDMLANKLSAVIDRTEPKDFADILLLLRQPGITLAQGMADATRKFGWPAIDLLLQQAFIRGARLTFWLELDPPMPLEDARAELRGLAAGLVRLEE